MAFAPGHHNYHLDNTASFSLLKQLQCSLALSVPCLATPTSFDVVQCSLKVGLMTDGLNDHSTAVARVLLMVWHARGGGGGGVGREAEHFESHAYHSVAISTTTKKN